jgi:hypothetical protein
MACQILTYIIYTTGYCSSSSATFVASILIIILFISC